MKSRCDKLRRVLFCALLSVCVVGCGNASGTELKNNEGNVSVTGDANGDLAKKYSATSIALSDSQIMVDGKDISTNKSDAVYLANDIVFYLEGQDFTYGEGTEEDEHSQAEADAHAVVHITEPGSYVLSGTLSKGQIAIDLGENADDDPDAVVTLILNNADITCDVAPAVIFYNVYECCSDDEEDATNAVDTSKAGANVIIADGTENTVNGSYVARIYESVELNEAGTEVVDSEKLHKYDAAFYSKMSMNMNGEEENTGVLNIYAENEGLDSELHLTMNGGIINITSGNDGINTNEDGVSVTTINGGELNIVVDGATGEGDGIDSNGWLVINGGTVNAAACEKSMDAGIDSDMGIHINGGNVVATGNMLDEIADSRQNYVVFSFTSSQKGGTHYTLKNAEETIVGEWTPVHDFTMLVFSSDELVAGTYTLWNGDTQLSVQESGTGMMGGRGPMIGGQRPQKPEDGEIPQMPEGGERPQMPEGGEMPQMPEDGDMPQIPEGGEMPQIPEGGEMPQMPEDGEMPQMPENGERPQKPEGENPNGEGAKAGEPMERPEGNNNGNRETVTEFTITDGGNMFMVI